MASTTEKRRDKGAARTLRVEIRINPDTKALLQRAAAISSRSLSDFVVTGAQQEAERTIREHDVISLSIRDSQRFADLVQNPPEPNDYLRAAMERHRSDVQSDV